MAADLDSGRVNQKLRTRQALLRAADDLLNQGRHPTFDEVAEAAMVSRATAYRYFSSVDAIVTEATIQRTIQEPEIVLAGKVDLLDRALAAVAATTNNFLENEVAAHAVSKSLAEAWLANPEGEGATRPARRMVLIDAAIDPHRSRLGDAVAGRLRAGLSLICGMEAVISVRDVARLDREGAQETFAWATTALVEAAEQQATPRRTRKSARN